MKFIAIASIIILSLLALGTESRAGGCDSQIIQDVATLNSTTQVTTAVIETLVDSACPLETIKRAIDPQNWSKCNPDNFQASYVVVNEDPRRPLDHAPIPGTSWSGVLFEDVKSSFWGLPYFSTKNLIQFDINQWSQPNMDGEYYRADYKLKKSLESVFVLKSYATAFDIDEGYIRVTKRNVGNSVKWDLYGVKYVHYNFTDLRDGSPVPTLTDFVNNNSTSQLEALLRSISNNGLKCDTSGK